MKLIDNHQSIIIVLTLVLLVLNFIPCSYSFIIDQQPLSSNEYCLNLPEVRSSSVSDKTTSENVLHRSSTRNLPTGSTSWPMFKNTADRTGRTDSSIPGTEISAPQVLWSNNTSSTFSSPVVAYGKVFLTTVDGHVYCFTETTGELRWKVRITNNTNAGLSTPAIGSGNLVVYSGGDGKLFRMSAYNGKLNWTYTVPGKNSTINITYIDNPVLIHSGRVLFGSANRGFYCLNETSGKLEWSFMTREGLTFDYGITGGACADGQRIYFGSYDGFLYTLDLAGFSNGDQGMTDLQHNSTDGDLIWKFFAGDSITSTPVVNNDYVYATVGVHNSTFGDYKIYSIYCIHKKNGTKFWELKTNDHIISSPTVQYNYVTFGSVDGKIYCLQTDSNNSVWAAPYQAQGAIWSSAAISDTKLVVGSRDGRIYCLYTDNGLVEWHKELNSPVVASPALANDRVYICSANGRLYSIGPADKTPPTIQKTVPIKNAASVPVTSKFILYFNERLDYRTVVPENFLLIDEFNNTIPLEPEYDDIALKVELTPLYFMNTTTNYNLKIFARIKDEAGNTLDTNGNSISDGSPVDDYLISFSTSDNNPPELLNAFVTPTQGNLGTDFIFAVLYIDRDNNSPGRNGKDVLLYINDEPKPKQMILNDTPNAPQKWRDGDYTDGEQYIYTTKLSKFGIYDFRIWCSDGSDWNQTIIKSKPIIPGPPMILPIEQLTIKEDEEYTLNLSNYIQDPDTQFSDLSIFVNSSYAEINDRFLSFLYTNSFTYPGGSRFDIVNLSVSDSAFFASTEILIWVEAVNDPPKILPIPDQLIVENTQENITLADYIYDVDNKFNELIINTTSEHAEIENGKLLIRYPTGDTEETIKLFVSDAINWTVSTINVSIIRADVSFVIREIPVQYMLEDIETEIDMIEYLMIISGSLNNLKVECSSKYSEVNGLIIKFLYNDSFTYINEFLKEDITIKVTDTTIDYQQTIKTRVIVTSLNDQPELKNGGVTPDFGNVTQIFNFEVFYFDRDGSENFKVFVVIDGFEYEMDWISNSKLDVSGARFTASTKVGIGNHYYYFTCNDGSKEPNSKYTTTTGQFYVTGNLDSCYNNPYNKPGMDPKSDLDKDGIPDCWEEHYNLDPTNILDALDDFDNDNFNNLQEYLGYDGLPLGNDSTDPTNASDMPGVKETKSDNNDLSMYQWLSLTGLLIIVIIAVNILYFLVTGRSIGKGMHIPKMLLRPEVGPKHPYTESDESDEDDYEEDDEDENDYEDDYDEEKDDDQMDDSQEDLESEDNELVVDMTASEEYLDIPITEVDLTLEDQPFFESEELLEELSGTDNVEAEEYTEVDEED